MKKVFEIIKANPLFEGIGLDEFESMFNCLEARTEVFARDEILLLAGSRVKFIGIILRGSVKVIKEDLGGNANILTELSASEAFAETFACAGISHSPVTIQATEECQVLFINYGKIINTCPASCVYHNKLIENMLNLLARKNLMLNNKIDILSKRTTRDKLLAFFDIYRGVAKKFTIPYNREELARYLCVDRSAMSNELSKMRSEGLINFRKNEFEILGVNVDETN